MSMKNPPHPGLSVRHDCLEPLGLSVTEAAKRLGVSRKQLSAIVNGHPFRQGLWRWRRYMVPAAGGLRLGPGDEASRPDQDRATVAGGVGAAGKKTGEVCDGAAETVVCATSQATPSRNSCLTPP